MKTVVNDLSRGTFLKFSTGSDFIALKSRFSEQGGISDSFV